LPLHLIPLSASLTFCFYVARDPPDLHSFPTRRSSDLRPLVPQPREDRLVVARARGPPARGVRLMAIKGSLREASLPDVLQLLARSEEHTSELQSRENLVCRLLLEKKKEN